MPIHDFPIPSEAQAALSSELDDFVSGLSEDLPWTPPQLSDLHPGDLRGVEPLPVQLRDLPAPNDRSLLSSASLAGFRFLVERSSDIFAYADLIRAPSSITVPGPAGYVLSGFGWGPFAKAAVSALAAARALSQVQTADYELNLLAIPAIYVFSLWLKGLAGAEDILVPVAPLPPEVTPNEPYSADKLMESLGPAIRKELTFAPS
jgi:hypothetical protein